MLRRSSLVAASCTEPDRVLIGEVRLVEEVASVEIDQEADRPEIDASLEVLVDAKVDCVGDSESSLSCRSCALGVSGCPPDLGLAGVSVNA